MLKHGLLIVLSSLSRVGRGTVRRTIFDGEENDFRHSISATTRRQREGGVGGVDYYFRLGEEFEVIIGAGKMLEYTEYVGNYYGTSLACVNQTLDEGEDVFLEIEVQGAKQVEDKVSSGIFTFLTPPDLTELKLGITSRGMDGMSVIEERMAMAKKKIKMMVLYDHVVVNDEAPLAVRRIKDIIASEHFRAGRVIRKYIKMLGEM